MNRVVFFKAEALWTGHLFLACEERSRCRDCIRRAPCHPHFPER